MRKPPRKTRRRGSGEGGEEVIGRLQVKGRFGFITPQAGLGPDLFVRKSRMNSAMHGDTVAAVVSEDRWGRREGRITRIIERSPGPFAGTITGRGKARFLIPQGGGDPVRLGGGGGSPGLRAVIAIDSRPSPGVPPEGHVLEVLGPAGDPDVEAGMVRIIRMVPGAFPRKVREEVRRMPASVRRKDLADREDLRDLDCFTIDPADARDFDDAVSFRRIGRGRVEVGIHIADVSYYVREGTAIDAEAYRRATSTYLTGGVIPMLPERLSNGLCSLIEGEERLAVSLLLEMKPDGSILSERIVRSVIRSRRRFNYDEIDEIIEGGDDPLRGAVMGLVEIARRLNSMRSERGAIDLDLDEIKPVMDTSGRVVEVRRITRTWSHRMIEELMILANERVATRLLDAEGGIFRIHERPDPVKIEAFKRILRPLGLRVPSGERFLPGFLQDITEQVAGRPESRLVNLMLLRSMKEARYHDENLGHFGLASKAYTHFTSPIRRYPDLVVHRIMTARAGPGTKRDLAETARHSTDREREAESAEREDLRIRLMEFVSERLGEEMEGSISAVLDFGLFVELECGLDGFVPLSDLLDDYYDLDKAHISLRGRRTGVVWRIGDRVTVQLMHLNFEERKVDLRLLGRPQ